MDFNAIIYIVVSLLVSMVIHEFAHGLMAYILGDTTAKDEGRLTLNPLAHVDSQLSLIIPFICIAFGMPIIGGAKPVPVNSSKLKGKEWGMALVAFVGPLSNLILAFISAAVFYLFGGNLNPQILEMVRIFTSVNIGLMSFNLLPIPPLDGSKIIYPIAPDFVKRFFDKMKATRNSFLVILFVIVFYNQIVWFVHSVQSIILSFFMVFFK